MDPASLVGVARHLSLRPLRLRHSHSTVNGFRLANILPRPGFIATIIPPRLVSPANSKILPFRTLQCSEAKDIVPHCFLGEQGGKIVVFATHMWQPVGARQALPAICGLRRLPKGAILGSKTMERWLGEPASSRHRPRRFQGEPASDLSQLALRTPAPSRHRPAEGHLPRLGGVEGQRKHPAEGPRRG